MDSCNTYKRITATWSARNAFRFSLAKISATEYEHALIHNLPPNPLTSPTVDLGVCVQFIIVRVSDGAFPRSHIAGIGRGPVHMSRTPCANNQSMLSMMFCRTAKSASKRSALHLPFAKCLVYVVHMANPLHGHTHTPTWPSATCQRFRLGRLWFACHIPTGGQLAPIEIVEHLERKCTVIDSAPMWMLTLNLCASHSPFAEILMRFRGGEHDSMQLENA